MNYYLAKDIRITSLAIVCSFLFAGNVFAHRVNVFAWIEGETVVVEGKFSGGKKVKEGRIIVTDSSGLELLTGKTNHQGQFSFKIPQRTDLKIILEAGMGHRAEWTIPVDDIQSIAPADDMRLEKITAKKEPSSKSTQYKQQASMPARIPAADIEAMIEKALDKKLKPLLKMLAESSRKGPTISDILGGIGYIIGLVGIAAYFRYRKRDVRSQ